MRKASEIEIFIDSLIPYALIAIIAVTIAEMFFLKFVQPYYWIIDTVDIAVIVVFVVDLYFKFRHARSIPDFLKHYWIYIVAIFPFFLIFRIVERFSQIAVTPSGPTLILGRYIATLWEEARLVRFARLFRFLGVSSRLVRAVYFYEHPKVRHKINAKRLLNLRK